MLFGSMAPVSFKQPGLVRCSYAPRAPLYVSDTWAVTEVCSTILFRFMPRQYQRKTTRGTFTKHAIKMAFAAHFEGKSLRKVVSDCGVNYKTLQRYVNLLKTDGNIEKPTFGYSTQKSKFRWTTSLKPLQSSMA
ncbi:uncharacterized protein LOC131933623 [Physella acuta]|uniref:uncharacterized protein LOC131933623 n=1 Tax=Physella acuta TaxID=109671 RepID=UPI0027DADF61|nr:uncharacterized protein LOC131933623 [Physella acuta]